MERLTKTMSCQDGARLYDISNELFGLNTSRADKTRMILEKLAKYEDLEERLNKVYGDCDGLLLRVVSMLEKHPGIDMANNTLKSRLITDEDVDKWEEYKQLEEQGRFVKLPCKVGDVVWNYSYFGLRDYKVTYMGFDKNGLLYFDCKSGITYGFRCYLKDFKDKIFLTKSEAEAKLEELRGNND
jgi:regulator of replication initiation timing